MTDTEKMREVARLQAELNAAEAEHAAKVQAIREQINQLCGISTTKYKLGRKIPRDNFAKVCGL